MKHHQLTKLFEINPASTASADTSILLDSTISALKNVFLQLISILTDLFFERVSLHPFYP